MPLDVRVHPLVVMSVADHSTRNTYQFGSANVMGLLMGQRSGSVLQLVDCFPVVFTETEHSVTIDEENTNQDLKFYRQANPENEVLGWYATRSSVLPAFNAVHQQVTAYEEGPVFLLLNPVEDPNATELPMKVFEAQNGEFVSVAFKVESDEAERLTAVHCAKIAQDDKNDDVSAAQGPFTQISESLRSLNVRVELVAKYLEDVKSGDTKADEGLLREIRGLCNRLPTMDTDSFKKDYMREMNDSLLLTYLASITKNTATAQQVVSNFSKAHAGHNFGGSRRRDGGLGGMMGGLTGIFGGGMGLF